VAAYQWSLLDRFVNPALRHRVVPDRDGRHPEAAAAADAAVKAALRDVS
jgi:hypothetical protein